MFDTDIHVMSTNAGPAAGRPDAAATMIAVATATLREATFMPPLHSETDTPAATGTRDTTDPTRDRSIGRDAKGTASPAVWPSTRRPARARPLRLRFQVARAPAADGDRRATEDDGPRTTTAADRKSSSDMAAGRARLWPPWR